MAIHRLILGVLASTSALGLASTPVVAGTFSISPVRVELSPGAQTGAVTIRNQEATPVVVQAEVVLWDQVDSQDQLSPTRELLVSPPVFTLPGNGSQLVRVALRRAADAQRELSYRLILTEVPQQASAEFTGLNVALRLSLPVFVAPSSPSRPRLEWSATRTEAGKIALTARNTGNSHARVLSFSVASTSEPSNPIPQDVTSYILPDRSRTWTLDDDRIGASSGAYRVRVRGTSEAGDFDVEMPLEGQ